MCEQATGSCQGHKYTSKPAAIYRRQQSNTPPRCIKAAFVNVAPLRWKLTAACLASSPPTAGHCLFFFVTSLLNVQTIKDQPGLRSTQAELIIPSVNPPAKPVSTRDADGGGALTSGRRWGVAGKYSHTFWKRSLKLLCVLILIRCTSAHGIGMQTCSLPLCKQINK